MTSRERLKEMLRDSLSPKRWDKQRHRGDSLVLMGIYVAAQGFLAICDQISDLQGDVRRRILRLNATLKDIEQRMQHQTTVHRKGLDAIAEELKKVNENKTESS